MEGRHIIGGMIHMGLHTRLYAARAAKSVRDQEQVAKQLRPEDDRADPPSPDEETTSIPEQRQPADRRAARPRSVTGRTARGSG